MQFSKYAEPTDRMKQLLDGAKLIALTEDENELFAAMNKHRNWENLGKAIAAVAERVGVDMPSGRVAYDGVNKRLMVVD